MSKIFKIKYIKYIQDFITINRVDYPIAWYPPPFLFIHGCQIYPLPRLLSPPNRSSMLYLWRFSSLFHSILRSEHRFFHPHSFISRFRSIFSLSTNSIRDIIIEVFGKMLLAFSLIVFLTVPRKERREKIVKKGENFN